MPEIANQIAKTVAGKISRREGAVVGKEIADKVVDRTVKATLGRDVLKTTEKVVAELPKVKIPGKLELLVSSDVALEGPRFSPDGKDLVYIRAEEKDLWGWVKKLFGLSKEEKAEKFTAWIAPVDGKSPPVKIAGKTFDNVVQPTFRPDGKAVLYAEQKHTPLTARGERLHDMKLTEFDRVTGKTRVIHDSDLTLIHPSYSPDGKQIAAYSRQPGKEGLYLLDATKPGSEPIRLTTFDDKHPLWTADGKRIVFHNQTGGTEEGAEKAWIGYMDMTDPKNPKRHIVEDQSVDTYHKHPTQLGDSNLVVYHVDDGGNKRLEVMDILTGKKGRLDLDGLSPNGSHLKELKHAAFSQDGNELVVLAKASKKDAVDRGLPEHYRAYMLQDAHQIIDAFQAVLGK